MKPPRKSNNPITDNPIARCIQRCSKMINASPINPIPELNTMILAERMPLFLEKRMIHDAHRKQVNAGKYKNM